MGGMTSELTPRLGLTTYSSGADPHPGRAEHNARMARLDDLVAIALQGTAAARPAAGVRGRLYWSTDTSRLSWDTGTAWADVSTIGGGGAGAPVKVNAAGTEGTSARAARADHSHPLPLATPTAHGAMSSAYAGLLQGAGSSPNADTIVRRDAAGRARFADPADPADAASKGYVDTAVNTRTAAAHTHPWSDLTGVPSTFTPSAHTHPWAELTGKPSTFTPSAHTHSATDLTSGVLAPERLPAASATAQGALSPTLFSRLNGATSTATGSTLAMRTPGGMLEVATPTAAAHAATKAYVDEKVGTAGAGKHTHVWADLTDVPADIAGRTAQTTGNTVVTRTAAGNFFVNYPTDGAHPTPKNYVDQQLAAHDRITTPNGLGYMAATDTYVGLRYNGAWKWAVRISDGEMYIGSLPWTSVTGKPSTFTPSEHTHSATDLTSGTVPYARVQGTTGPHNYAVSGSGTFYSVWVDGDGRFGRNTSSRRFKANELPWEGNAAGVLALEPVTYVRRAEDGSVPDDAPREFGLIAEDVDQHVPELVIRDADGVVDGVRYELLPVAMLPVLRDLAARVEALEVNARA